MRLVRFRERRTDLLIPKASLSVVPPTAPVFFNPAASTNRDLSVALVGATEGRTFCDALAGVGARGVRVAKEVRRNVEVVLADFNRESIGLARRSAGLNGVLERCKFVAGEANSYLYSRYGRDEKFDYIDVDPFGTPVPFLQSALRTTKDGGIVSFTATDTAVLCGVHKEVALRRYGGVPLNNHFPHETGVRLLLNAVRRQAASFDLGIRPVAAHSTRHYIRAYARVEVGPSKADAAMKGEGFVVCCRDNGHIEASENPSRTCSTCGGKARSAGPLWLGSLTEKEVVSKALGRAEKLGFREATRILSSLEEVDRFPPWSFSIERICSDLKVATVPESAVAGALKNSGYSCVRQPFEKTGLKTDAPYEEVVGAVKSALS